MTENNLRTYVNEFFEGLELYDDHKNGHKYKDLLTAAIDVFFDYESNYSAFEVYEIFLMIYQVTSEDKSEGKFDPNIISEPNTLLDLVNSMKDYEQKTGDLIEKQRDHFIHSVNVFLLGLAVYSQNKNFRNVFKKYVTKSQYKKYYKDKNGNFSDEEFLYRWGIAALFHDIGYPFEIIGKQLDKIIKDSVSSISNTYDVEVGLDFKDFEEFNSIVRVEPFNFADSYRSLYDRSKIIDLFKPTEIMAHKIAHNFKFSNSEYRILLKDLNNLVIRMNRQNFIDHGFFSAILVLNSYGHLIQKYSNKSNEFFFYPIVDSATAILLHNYYSKTLQKEEFFGLGPLYVESHPIAYLLILCDELQEWNRQPFGVLDKQRSHVNDLNIKITNVRMDVDYILNNGSMGMGFNDEKENTIKRTIDVKRKMFSRGLSVTVKTTPKIDRNIMRDTDIVDIHAPDILMRNIESLAFEVHQQYIDTTTAQYEAMDKNNPDPKIVEKYENLKPFDELSPHLKMANIRQAKSIPKKLDLIGCEIAGKKDKRPKITKFLKSEVEDLAIYEHQEWCREKEGTGWTFAEKKNVEELKSPYLVPWDELDEKTRDFDRDSIKNIPNLLNSIGLKVVRSKIRLLTFEMHKQYLKETGVTKVNIKGKEKDIDKCNSVDLFDQLDDYIKYSNFKQAKFIVSILNERNYELVDQTVGDKKYVEEFEFDEDDLDYFAERVHQNWYALKVNMGWTYGKKIKEEPEGETDEDAVEEKISPNLLPWEELDDSIKEHYSIKEQNRRTFENLPELCNRKNIKLKIVKIK